MKKKFYQNFINIFIIYIIITIDYFSKKFIILLFKNNEKKHIHQFLNIQYIKNYGLIFGLYEKKIKFNEYFFYIINLISFLSIILIIYLLFKKKKSNNLIFSLLISGSLGNFFNRLNYGYIIDFIDIHYNNYHLPTFNIADISIFIGFTLFLIKKF